MQQSIIAVWLGCTMHIHWCAFVPPWTRTLQPMLPHCLNIERPIICMRWARMSSYAAAAIFAWIQFIPQIRIQSIYTDNSLDPFQSTAPSLPLSSHPYEWNTPRSLCSLTGAKNRLPFVITIYCAFVCRSNWICKHKNSIYCMLCVRVGGIVCIYSSASRHRQSWAATTPRKTQTQTRARAIWRLALEFYYSIRN